MLGIMHHAAQAILSSRGNGPHLEIASNLMVPSGLECVVQAITSLILVGISDPVFGPYFKVLRLSTEREVDFDHILEALLYLRRLVA